MIKVQATLAGNAYIQINEMSIPLTINQTYKLLSFIKYNFMDERDSDVSKDATIMLQVYIERVPIKSNAR